MSFRGNHPTRIDEKGRLKMPADFKRVVDEEFGPRFYITSQDGQRAEIYPIKVWEAKEQKLLTLGSMSPVRKKLMDRFMFFGHETEMDAQGRLLLPQILRERAMLKDDVVVLGSTNFLEVANRAQFEAAMDAAPFTADELDVLAKLEL